MKTVRLGSTGIEVKQNAFGALPIQRASKEEAVKILHKAYEGGMRYFDTARVYSDSEEKLGEAFKDVRENIYLATKSMSRTPEGVKADLETSLKLLQTDYIDVYQFHMVDRCYKPGDGTGMYEVMQEAKEAGKIRHIGITTHKLQVAEEIIESGLYETLQYPFSYLSSEKEIEMVKRCGEKNIGFVCMKGLAGGLITRSEVAMAFAGEFDNIVPIWGIQRESELDEWLSYFENTPVMTDEIREYIENERRELAGEFCRGCGYCLPCPMEIKIPTAARMSLLLRRAPSENYLTEAMQAEMNKIDDCIGCYSCASKCPYELDTSALLKRNLEDYRKVLAGEVKVR